MRGAGEVEGERGSRVGADGDPLQRAKGIAGAGMAEPAFVVVAVYNAQGFVIDLHVGVRAVAIPALHTVLAKDAEVVCEVGCGGDDRRRNISVAMGGIGDVLLYLEGAAAAIAAAGALQEVASVLYGNGSAVNKRAVQREGAIVGHRKRGTCCQ